MTTQIVTIQNLIDIAIGNPKRGVVNFNALYTVLQAFNKKLDLHDELIEIDSSFCPVGSNVLQSNDNVSCERLIDHRAYDTCYENSQSYNRIETQDEEIEDEDQKSSISSAQVVVWDEHAFSTATSSARRNNEAEHQSSQIWQHIDVINSRLEKIENILVTSADIESSVENFGQIVKQLQDKLDKVEKSIYELKNTRNNEDQNASVSQQKLEYEKLTDITDGLKHELAEVWKSIQLQDPTCAIDKTTELKDMCSNVQKQLIDVKTNLSRLTEQLTTIEQDLILSDKQSAMTTLHTFEQEMLALKKHIGSVSEDQTACKREIEDQKIVTEELTNKLSELSASKIDKEEVDELLSEKADYTMLQKKVSVENMDADHRKLEKQISEIAECLLSNEERVQNQISDVRKFIGDQSIEDMMYDFKVQVDKEVQEVRNAIRRLANMKPDVEAAGAKLRNLRCLSCDQNVVMKAFEVSNLSKFGDAYVTQSISPLIASNVGKLREAGKLSTLSAEVGICNMSRSLRSSGGIKTIITREDRVSKIRSHIPH